MIKSAVKSESTEKKLLWDLFDSRVCFLHTALLQPISKFPASKSYLTFIRQEKSRQKKKKWGNMIQVRMFKRSCGQNMFQDKQFKVGDILEILPSKGNLLIFVMKEVKVKEKTSTYLLCTQTEKKETSKKRNRKKVFRF